MHPLLNLDDVDVIGYDTLAGYCDPSLTTASYARRASELGVAIRLETPVTGIRLEGQIKLVQTPSGTIESPTLILAAGPWTSAIGEMMGIEFPYVTSRNKVVTLRAGQPYRRSWPIVKDLTTPDKIYMRPTSGDMVLVGTGDHGDPIEDPDALTDEVDGDHVARIRRPMSNRMPSFEGADYTAGWTGPYDTTPDWNPIVGPVPGAEGVHVAVGFSGHGFKLAPTIGESLAQTALGMKPRVAIDNYAMTRFAENKALHGAYGVGSIA